MINWQVTATTIHCDAVDDQVTLMVYKDRSTHCTGYAAYCQSDKETRKLLSKKSRQLKRNLECEGPECYRVIQYRDRLFSEKL